MASNQSTTGIRSFDAAFNQVQDASDKFLATARKAGNLYLDSYEKAVDRAVKLELELAGLTKQEWVKTLIEAQADMARDVANAYTTTARTLLK
jgi:hypothetical protein